MRGRVTAWDVFSWAIHGVRVNSQDHSRSQVHMSKLLNGKDKQQHTSWKQDGHEDYRDSLYIWIHETNSMAVFHNLCRDYQEITAKNVQKKSQKMSKNVKKQKSKNQKFPNLKISKKIMTRMKNKNYKKINQTQVLQQYFKNSKKIQKNAKTKTKMTKKDKKWQKMPK